MKYCYHPGYHVPLSPDHPYPMSKYQLLYETLRAEGLLTAANLLQPEPIAFAALARIHTAEYLAKLTGDGLNAGELRKLGLPWSEALWRRSLLAAGGTLLAARTALAEGLAANLAGGTHHAFADHGEGFCVLNDVAVTIQQLRAEGLIRRALIIDLDVHQGNGTAAIFTGDEAVFTFSMHGAKNYPLAKVPSTLDIDLADGTADEEYLALLDHHLPDVMQRARADIAFYVAGVDVAAGDRYGKLALTDTGVRKREERVIKAVRGAGIPLAIVLAGGYASTRERTAALHMHVLRTAAACAGIVKRPSAP